LPTYYSRASSAIDRGARALLWISLALGSILALYVCYLVAAQELLVGSRDGRWVYGYLQPFRYWTLIMVLGSSVACFWLLREEDSGSLTKPWRQIFAWLMIGLGVQVALRSLSPFSFERIFTSTGANSFYTVTTHYFASTVMTDFDRMREYFPLHAQSNMPGKVMLLYALRYLSKEPVVLAWLIVLVSNLGAVLMYFFVKDLFYDDKRMAKIAAVLYLLVPSKLFFFPLMNTVTPVVTLLSACLLMRWLTRGLGIYAWLLGISLYALVFFEPLPLVMGVLFAALVIRTLAVSEVTASRFAIHAGFVVLGFAAAYAAVFFVFGFDLLHAFRQIATDAVAFNEKAGRPYDIWVRENLKEFLFGMGVCQAVLVAAALVDGLLRNDVTEPRLGRPIVVLCLSLVVTLVATDLIGINRGEITRLWIFLACFFQIPAAYVCARLETRLAVGVVIATTLLQAGLGTAMIGFILPG
jgi:methylthioxylose transferase